jgi:HD domain
VTDVPVLPGDPLAVRAVEFASAHEHPALVNHSVRTYLHAVFAARGLGMDYPADLLFLACILHDIGTSDAYDGAQRFEVEGADAAATFLSEQGMGAAAVDQVWEAIALHTSPHIAERRGPVTALTRLGVRADFGAATGGGDSDRASLESRYPRLDIERVRRDAVVAQALRDPGKAPASSWPGGLLQAHLAGGEDAF